MPTLEELQAEIDRLEKENEELKCKILSIIKSKDKG